MERKRKDYKLSLFLDDKKGKILELMRVQQLAGPKETHLKE